MGGKATHGWQSHTSPLSDTFPKTAPQSMVRHGFIVSKKNLKNRLPYESFSFLKHFTFLPLKGHNLLNLHLFLWAFNNIKLKLPLFLLSSFKNYSRFCFVALLCHKLLC